MNSQVFEIGFGNEFPQPGSLPGLKLDQIEFVVVLRYESHLVDSQVEQNPEDHLIGICVTDDQDGS